MLQNFIINYRIQGLAAGAIQKVLLRTAYCTYVDSHMWGISSYNPSVSRGPLVLVLPIQDGFQWRIC